MDFKKIIVRSLWGVGIGLVLIFLFSALLILQRNLSIPKVQASPGPDCTVNDKLIVNKELIVNDARISFTGTDGAGYSWIKRNLDDSQMLIGWDPNRNAIIPQKLVLSKYAPKTSEINNDTALIRFYQNSECTASDEGKITYKNDRQVGELCVCARGKGGGIYFWLCISSGADYW
jgi:hypothetical protein